MTLSRSGPLSKMNQARAVARGPPIRQHLTYEQKLDVINFYHRFKRHLSMEGMVPYLREMGYSTIFATTVRRLVDSEEKIRQYVAEDPNRLRAKQESIVTHPQVEHALIRWVDHKLNNNIRLSGDLLIEKALELCDPLRIPQEDRIGFSTGWLRGFKHRRGLHRVRFHGEHASAPIAYILSEQRRLQSILALYHPKDRLNMDETALLFRQSSATGLARYESGGTKRDKRRLTFALCSNEDGSFKLPPLIIGHAEHPRCFPRYRTPREHGYRYFNNQNAWMKAPVWVEFLFTLNEMMRRENRYVLLLCDNASSHKHNPADFPHVRVEYLLPNLTPWVQPMDAGIITAFKARYRRRLARLAIQRDEMGFVNAYKVNQHEAMQLAVAAWNDVTPETIANCWHHTGIVPPEEHSIKALPVEPHVDNSIDDLVAELNLNPEYTHQEVYDMLAALQLDLPTEEDLSMQQILQELRYNIPN